MATLQAGSVFAERYEILSVVGCGGMGTVYRARHLGLGKHVALKVLATSSVNEQEVRFEREARAIARLDHPSCVRVLDFDRSEQGHPYLAMELLEGPTLGQVLGEQGRLSIGRAVAITRNLLTALAHAHAHGVLHRDLKPENVILASRGVSRAVLIDFGLAHVVDEASLTARGMCIGSPSYLAPERLGGATYDVRAELYAIGVLLYEMLAGERPFTGATTEEILRKCRERPARPLRAIRPEVSRTLEQVVVRAMSKDPAHRFADAEDMLAALEDVPVLDELEQRARIEVREEQATTMAFAVLEVQRASTWSRMWSWLRFGRWRLRTID
ncbi:MAG: serine/threonine protein kinase [Deltaproteobacteria bacterium]|nr:serine/threonine protein kinase [Deltaproteobacteria bacterium]